MFWGTVKNPLEWLANPHPYGAFYPVKPNKLPTALVENKQENGKALFF